MSRTEYGDGSLAVLVLSVGTEKKRHRGGRGAESFSMYLVGRKLQFLPLRFSF